MAEELRGYVVIDTETTGLNRDRKDRIAELAVATFDTDFNLTGKYETLLNPERDLGPTSLHGISAEMVSAAPRFADIKDSLTQLLHGRILIGHSVRFDLKILEDEYSRLGSEFLWKKAHRDTFLLALSLKLPVSDYKLGSLCEHFGIRLDNAHTAMADVMATAELFPILTGLKGNGFASDRVPFQSSLMSFDCPEYSCWLSRQMVLESTTL